MHIFRYDIIQNRRKTLGNLRETFVIGMDSVSSHFRQVIHERQAVNQVQMLILRLRRDLAHRLAVILQFETNLAGGPCRFR